MSDQKKARTLLPDNRTHYEVSFEQAARKLVESDNFYDWLTDPQKTEIQLLDIMAKEAGVSDWFADDIESDRRNSIEKAPSIHRRAGTKQGILDGLAALGCTAQIKRGKLPYSLQIFNLIVNKPLTEDLQSRLKKRVDTVKSERDIIKLELGRFWLIDNYLPTKISKGKELRFKDHND